MCRDLEFRTLPYRIDVDTAGETALDVLVDLGALDVERLGDGSLAAILPDSVVPERVESALGVERFSLSAAVGRDDGSVWIVQPRPIRIGLTTLLLSDASVFGTGLHPTTALCLDLLGDAISNLRPDGLLDVGTGSGVLALGALILGVPRAIAVDTDSDALEIARENARVNGLEERLTTVRGGPEVVAGRWPLVVANILAAPLMEMAPTLVRCVAGRGRLVLSGMSSATLADVDRTYRNLGMWRVEVRSRGGWDAVVLDASW